MGRPGRLSWKRALLVPRRFELAATTGRSGVTAFRALYRPRRLRARLGTPLSVFALTLRAGIPASDAAEAALELSEIAEVRPDGGALVRSRNSGRATLGLTEHGRLSLVLKTAPDHDRVEREAGVLRRVHGNIPGVIAPAVHWVRPWREQLAMATAALTPTRDARDVDVEEALDVAVALAQGTEEDGPVVHGDFAPWNALRTPDGVALVDWESGRFELDPMYDLAHFVTSQGSLLGSHPPVEAVRLLTGGGSPGWRYLEALGLDPLEAPDHVRRYIARATSRGDAAVRRYRQDMLRLLAAVAPERAA
jgi:hypothetical protein